MQALLARIPPLPFPTAAIRRHRLDAQAQLVRRKGQIALDIARETADGEAPFECRDRLFDAPRLDTGIIAQDALQHDHEGAALLLFNLLAMPLINEHRVEEVDYGTFMGMTERQEIGKVEIEDDEILFTNQDGSKIYKTGAMDDTGLTERLYASGAAFTKVAPATMSPLLSFLLTWLLPLVIFIGIGQYMYKKLLERAGGGGNSMMFGMGKSNAKVYVPSSEGIRFDDVAGEDEAKENLSEIVDYLHNPQKYAEVGASMPKGVLLVGPPGTGKTMLAKAVAGEAGVPFFSMSGSEFVEMFVGMGASKVRDLFQQAKEKAPCIVFIDEIDAIGQKRDGRGLGGNDEREQTLNQLLTEMDGFEGNNGVIILAATNRPETLDPALTRPGRFDRRVPVELPDLQGRVAILQVHARKVRLSDDVDLKVIARMAAGASGAELANMINEGALRAVRNGRKIVTQADLEESVEVVIAGYQKKNGPRARRCKTVELRTRAEDHHHPPHLRCAGIHHAGRAGGQKSHVPRGDRKSHHHAHRRPRCGGGRLPPHHHRRVERHRAGYQARPRHGHTLRHD